jgi:hypothetical protein
VAVRVEQRHEQGHEDRPVGMAMLIFAMLAGPVAWSLRLMIAYPLVLLACNTGWEFLLYLVSGVTAAGAIAGGVVSRIVWRRARTQARARGPGNRSLFVGIFGMASSALFLVAILVESFAIVQLNPCTTQTQPMLIRDYQAPGAEQVAPACITLEHAT